MAVSRGAQAGRDSMDGRTSCWSRVDGIWVMQRQGEKCVRSFLRTDSELAGLVEVSEAIRARSERGGVGCRRREESDGMKLSNRRSREQRSRK